MGNVLISCVEKTRKNHQNNSTAKLGQPGKPLVMLSKFSNSKNVENLNILSTSSELLDSAVISDQVVISWRPSHVSKSDKKKIKYHLIEMWDLGNCEWVPVTKVPFRSNASKCCSELANILCGILYRFRIKAFDENDNGSEPSLPSDPFVVHIPGVSIAPYWLLKPNTSINIRAGTALVLSAEALGTPMPSIQWYRGDEEIFIRDDIEIYSEGEGKSTLLVENIGIDDGGDFSCIARNSLGKIIHDISLNVYAVPRFHSLKHKFNYQQGDFVRISIRLSGMPIPKVIISKQKSSDTELKIDPIECYLKKGMLTLRIEHIDRSLHAGCWSILAENEHGSSIFVIELFVNASPQKPGVPRIVSCSTDGCIDLEWDEIDTRIDGDKVLNVNYQVDYFRDQWQMWLKSTVSNIPQCQITNLIPGSYYQFRVTAFLKDSSDMSEPSNASEKIFIGSPLEDEVFGLPGGNYPGFDSPAWNRVNLSSRKTSKLFSSLSRVDKQIEANPNGRKLGNIALNRQASLDREVYYSAGDERYEVVTYTACYKSDVVGAACKQWGLDKADTDVYKQSLSNLCTQLQLVSTLAKQSSSTTSIDQTYLLNKKEITPKTNESIKTFSDKSGSRESIFQRLNKAEKQIYHSSLMLLESQLRSKCKSSEMLCNISKSYSNVIIPCTQKKWKSLEAISTDSVGRHKVAHKSLFRFSSLQYMHNLSSNTIRTSLY